MTHLEQKSIETQLQLLKEILSAQESIVFGIRTDGGQILNDISENPPKSNEETVTLSLKTFKEIKDFLWALSHKSNKSSFAKLSNNYIGRYLEEIETKKRILDMLS